jgi:hypothetical protein
VSETVEFFPNCPVQDCYWCSGSFHCSRPSNCKADRLPTTATPSPTPREALAEKLAGMSVYFLQRIGGSFEALADAPSREDKLIVAKQLVGQLEFLNLLPSPDADRETLRWAQEFDEGG